MTAESHQFAFIAVIHKVQSLADGGIRVAFDLPETAITEAALLMECQRAKIALDINCKATGYNAIPERQVRKSTRTAPKEPRMDRDPEAGWEQDDPDGEGWEEGSEEEDYS